MAAATLGSAGSSQVEAPDVPAVPALAFSRPASPLGSPIPSPPFRSALPHSPLRLASSSRVPLGSGRRWILLPAPPPPQVC